MGVRGIKNLSQIITFKGVHKKGGRKPIREDLAIVKDGAIVFDSNKIYWCGHSSNIPDEYKDISWDIRSGHILTPEIVDSHTHLVFGGNRAEEYSMRLDGADYQAIADAGGGILSTMKMTNQSTETELFESAVKRIERIHSFGVGTIEIKSGYALNIEKEIETTKIIDRLKKHFAPKVQIFNTFMAAHAVNPKYEYSSDYLEEVVYPTLDKLIPLKIIDAADIFHEKGYFGNEETRAFFEYCRANGIKVKSHADEFNDNNGASLACEYNALSADHLLCTGTKGIESFSNSNTVATLLPGTGFFLGKSQANARALINGGAKLALASDYNPGSCHCDNLLLIASLCAPNLKLSLAELWSAICYNSAHALGLYDQGALIPGMKPRMSLFNVGQIDEITYSWGKNFNVPYDFTQVI